MLHIITEGSGGDDASGSNTTSVTELSPVTCRENFVLINSTCQPICHLWEQDTHAVSLTLTTIKIIAGSMGLIIGLSAIVISFIDRKRMWESTHFVYMHVTDDGWVWYFLPLRFQFPSVSVVYLNIGYCIYGNTPYVPCCDIIHDCASISQLLLYSSAWLLISICIAAQ